MEEAGRELNKEPAALTDESESYLTSTQESEPVLDSSITENILNSLESHLRNNDFTDSAGKCDSPITNNFISTDIPETIVEETRNNDCTDNIFKISEIDAVSSVEPNDSDFRIDAIEADLLANKLQNTAESFLPVLNDCSEAMDVDDTFPCEEPSEVSTGKDVEMDVEASTAESTSKSLSAVVEEREVDCSAPLEESKMDADNGGILSRENTETMEQVEPECNTTSDGGGGGIDVPQEEANNDVEMAEREKAESSEENAEASSSKEPDEGAEAPQSTIDETSGSEALAEVDNSAAGDSFSVGDSSASNSGKDKSAEENVAKENAAVEDTAGSETLAAVDNNSTTEDKEINSLSTECALNTDKDTTVEESRSEITQSSLPNDDNAEGGSVSVSESEKEGSNVNSPKPLSVSSFSMDVEDITSSTETTRTDNKAQGASKDASSATTNESEKDGCKNSPKPSSVSSFSIDVEDITNSKASGKTDKKGTITMSTSLMATSVSSSAQTAETADDNDDDDVIIIPHDAKDVEDLGAERREIEVVALTTSTSVEHVQMPQTQMCAQCKQIKLCSLRLGQLQLCSEACHEALRHQSAEALAQRACQECHKPLPVSQIVWQTMDFCSEACIDQYQAVIGSRCAQCSNIVPATHLGKYCVRFGCALKQFCDGKCLDLHKRGLRLCSFCQNVLTHQEIRLSSKEFCTTACLKNYERAAKRGELLTDVCAVCSNIKPITVEVQQGPKLSHLCTDLCFAAFKFVNNITNEGRCNQCQKFYDKTLSEKIVIFVNERPLNFCTKSCLNVYILETRRIVSCVRCRVKKYDHDMICKVGVTPTLGCSLLCLRLSVQCADCGTSLSGRFNTALVNGTIKKVCAPSCKPQGSKSGSICLSTNVSNENSGAAVRPQAIYQNVITKPPLPKDYKNKAILCKPFMHNKGTSCRPMPCHKESQTCESLNPKMVIPIPVPIYIPSPTVMYSNPYPIPIPIPIAVPIPIFIPTTRNSAKGIMKEIRKIHEKMPADPFEAELLMMAEMVAGVKKQDVTDSESDGETHDVTHDVTETYSPEPVDAGNSFGDDIMQMALFASDLAEPQVDMESVLTSNTITPSQQSPVDNKNIYGVQPVQEESPHIMAMRGRKRPNRGTSPRGGAAQNKRGRRSNTPNDHNMHQGNMHHGMGMTHMPPPEPQRLEVEKPDANMRLKYTFGVNAWRHWVMQKNQELEKAMMMNRKIKPFKPDLLQLTADELNFSLCLFIKEVKKPNGQEYAPDTIYYLCLGIQQYLFENGRIDNIFTDMYYEKFTECLDEVAKKFAALYDDSHYIVTRVEEEHLWESKQLGAHSPHVLLSTLMFFNTKHFNLVTVEEHMQLSFSHIMKHWKRNPNAPGVTKVPGSRNVLLRFYPPQSALEANSRKKKVYEQQENEENPLRCPVKLYEFYLSKCPESVKTRNDVFYLLPERSCVPDSPVWYSTMALGKEPLMKMLHRVKMVKEINVALLTS